MSTTVLLTKQAQKDARKLASASPALKQKAQALLDSLAVDPDQQPPPDEALIGDLEGPAPGASTSSTVSWFRCWRRSRS